MSAKKRVYKAGVFFDCTECGELLRDCGAHHQADPSECPKCDGEMRIVGIGSGMVQGAIWLRCLSCKKLFMRRRGEVVETKPRSGFDRYA